MNTVFKSNGIIYVTDSSGTWIVTKGNCPNPYSIGKEFSFKRTWLSTSNMCKYGEFDSYDDMINRIRTLIN